MFTTVCAWDANTTPSINKTCDGRIEMEPVPDSVAPVIGSLAASASSVNSGVAYNLTWTVSDNVSAAGNIMVSVQRKITNSPTDWPEGTEANEASGFGLTSLNGQSYTTQPLNFGRYVTYRVRLIDQAGNQTIGNLAVAVQMNTIINAANRATFENQAWVIPSGSTVSVNLDQAAAIMNVNSIELQGTARLTHGVCDTTKCYALKLQVAGDVTVGASASIDANGKGYLGGFRCGADGVLNNAASGQTLNHIAGQVAGRFWCHAGRGGLYPGYSVPDLMEISLLQHPRWRRWR